MTVISQLLQSSGVSRFVAKQRRKKADPTLPLALSLAGAAVGQPLRLVAVRADHKLVHRLAELGLTPGITLSVVQDAGGPLLLAVRGARIAIGRDLAQQIEVAPLASSAVAG